MFSPNPAVFTLRMLSLVPFIARSSPVHSGAHPGAPLPAHWVSDAPLVLQSWVLDVLLTELTAVNSYSSDILNSTGGQFLHIAPLRCISHMLGLNI